MPVETCIIVDPARGPTPVAITQLDAKGAVLDTAVTYQVNEYIDAALEGAGGARHSLFAHVVSSGDGGLQLRWLHFDPSEEQKLVAFIESDGEAANAGHASGSQTRQRRRTRKVTRPSGPAAAPMPEPELDQGKPPQPGSRRTRKITRPSQPLPEVGAAASESRSNKVIKPSRHAAEEGEVAPFGAEITPFASSEVTEGSRRARRQTRKIIQPRDEVRPFEGDDYQPSDGSAGSGSSAGRQAITGVVLGARAGGEEAHDVVLASTARFDELQRQTDTRTRARVQTDDATAKERANVVGEDGRMDVGATIRSRAKTVNASELAARHERVRVLNLKTIKGLIADAVAEAVQHMSSSIDEAEKQRLLEEAEETFQERLKEFHAEQKGLKAQAENLQEQLARAESLLEEERHRKIEADQFTVSDAGLADMEKRFERIVHRSIAGKGVDEALEGELKGLITRMLDEEREHIADQARKAQGEAIALLEKKVGRLARSLESTQQERDKAKRQVQYMEASGGGISNVMQAGLDGEDPDREQKLALLKDVFEQNKALRTELKKQGIEIVSRRRPVPPEPAPEPEEPEEPEDDADLDEDLAPVDAPEHDTAAVSATTQEPPADAVAEELVHPDDLPWEPGMSFAQEFAGDNGDGSDSDDGAVKKIGAAAAIAAFEPPPLERDAPAGSAAESEPETESEEDAAIVNPDDLPWQPGMSFSQEVAGENEDGSDDGVVKKIGAADAIAAFEPPPLQRKEAGTE